MDYAKESLRLHGEWKGKIEVTATVPVETKDDLSLAYTPGVAQPCLAIREDPELSQRVKLIYHNPPPAEHGKDYNEFLCQVKAAQGQQRQREGAR